MAATSSVVCSIQNPASATSTLERFTALINANGIGVAQTVDIATSSTAYATSTPALAYAASIGTGEDHVVWTPGIASTTNPNVLAYDSWASTGESPFIIGPSEYLNMRIATGTPGTFSSYWTGNCTAVFGVLQ